MKELENFKIQKCTSKGKFTFCLVYFSQTKTRRTSIAEYLYI